MTIVGYARVSTVDQDAALQRDALNVANCERIFEDRASGSRTDRPELRRCMDYMRSGDTLVIWKLDRLGRSLPHLLEIADSLQERDIQLVITTMGIDTRTPGGRLLYQVLGAVAEYERSLIRERTSAGLAAARARGRVGGRRRALSDTQSRLARTMYEAVNDDGGKAYTVAEIAKELRVSRTTVYRYLPGGEHWSAA